MTDGLRVAIYARHSTTFQNPESSDDQVRSCGPLVERLGGRVVAVHTDPEMSGYRRDRPGLQEVLRLVRSDQVDIVVCEALDRIARDGEDVAWLGKKLRFDHVKLWTLTEGEIDEVKLAVASMMGSLFLGNLRKKTLRGMEAAILAGRLAGGRAFGYRAVDGFNDRGERIRGVVEIDPGTAPIVVRIAEEFASGKSSYRIATGLNAEGIPGPSGGKWNQSTIRGDPSKHVGILHNPLYRGRLIWGRREWRRDPDSLRRERRYRMRDAKEWVVKDVPDLRILTGELARRVDAEVARRARPNCQGNAVTARRGKHLLSGLIRCGACGANFIINGKDYYRCGGNREGRCDSRVTVRKSVLEDATLSVIQKDLMTAELAELFAREFTREVERLRSGNKTEIEVLEDRLATLDREIASLAQNFLHGVVSDTLAAMLADREREKDALVARLVKARGAHQAVVLPHPVLLERYAARVQQARLALNDPSVRDEAAQTLRALIDRITIYADQPQLYADVIGDPGKIIDFASAEPGTTRRKTASSITVVAGVGFEPTTFRL